MTKLAKGALVKLNDEACFTTTQGGGLRFPLTNYLNDEAGIVESRRPVTAEEEAEWYASPASHGINDAGESRLPPRSRYVPLHRGRIYQVLRARCRVRLSWGNATPGMAKILCTQTGEETYIKRELLEVV